MADTYGEVYLVTCVTTGKHYIGQTRQGIGKRWKQHCYHKSYILGRAIQKYGVNNFTIQVVDTASDQTELDSKEQFWIVKIGCKTPDGYNINKGGSQREISVETRERISIAGKGRTKSETVRAKISLAHKGKKISPEAVEKTRLALTGRKQTPEHIEKCRLGNLGRGKSPEAKERMRLGCLTRWAKQHALRESGSVPYATIALSQGGPSPYGFLRQDGKLVPEPSEQSLIRTIMALHKTGMSFKNITVKLAQSGQFSRSGTPLHTSKIHLLSKYTENNGLLYPPK